MARPIPSITAELAAISLLTQEPMESFQVREGGPGNGAELSCFFASRSIGSPGVCQHAQIRPIRAAAPIKTLKPVRVAINKRGDGAA